MPLPDALPDRRIYELLKTVDLENLTFSDFQKVAQTIYAEQGAEDELRRIVLLNLARLSVAGEWTGLTSAGGGGSLSYQNSGDYNVASGFGGEYWNLATQPAICNKITTTVVNQSSEYQFFNVFVAPFDGSPASCSISVTSASTSENLYVGFYERDTNGLPSTMMGYATISTASTGIQTVTSFTEASAGSLTFEAGKLYYYSINKDGTQNCSLTTVPNGETAVMVSDTNPTATSNRSQSIQTDFATTAAPSDKTETDFWNTGTGYLQRVWVWIKAN